MFGIKYFRNWHNHLSFQGTSDSRQQENCFCNYVWIKDISVTACSMCTGITKSGSLPQGYVIERKISYRPVQTLNTRPIMTWWPLTYFLATDAYAYWVYLSLSNQAMKEFPVTHDSRKASSRRTVDLYCWHLEINDPSSESEPFQRSTDQECPIILTDCTDSTKLFGLVLNNTTTQSNMGRNI